MRKANEYYQRAMGHFTDALKELDNRFTAAQRQVRKE